MYTGNERTLRYASADDSVMTYRGHAVCMTLIRCNFSPLATTGQQYIYSGSADGRIHVSFVVLLADRSAADQIRVIRADLVPRRPDSADIGSLACSSA